MNLVEFSTLDERVKIDYFVNLLQEARRVYAYIRDNCKLGITEEVVEELDYIGNVMLQCGELAEKGFFDEAFDELNQQLLRLKVLSEDIGGLLIN